MMPRPLTLAQLVFALVALGVARGCYYYLYMENPNDYMYRYCSVGCAQMSHDDNNFDQCCLPLTSGAPTPDVCTSLSSSCAAAGTTCQWTNVPTSDSTNAAAPTTSAAAASSGGGDTPNNGVITSTAWVTSTTTTPCGSSASGSVSPASTSAATSTASDSSASDASASSSPSTTVTASAAVTDTSTSTWSSGSSDSSQASPASSAAATATSIGTQVSSPSPSASACTCTSSANEGALPPSNWNKRDGDGGCVCETSTSAGILTSVITPSTSAGEGALPSDGWSAGNKRAMLAHSTKRNLPPDGWPSKKDSLPPPNFTPDNLKRELPPITSTVVVTVTTSHCTTNASATGTSLSGPREGALPGSSSTLSSNVITLRGMTQTTIFTTKTSVVSLPCPTLSTSTVAHTCACPTEGAMPSAGFQPDDQRKRDLPKTCACATTPPCTENEGALPPTGFSLSDRAYLTIRDVGLQRPTPAPTMPVNQLLHRRQEHMWPQERYLHAPQERDLESTTTVTSTTWTTVDGCSATATAGTGGDGDGDDDDDDCDDE